MQSVGLISDVKELNDDMKSTASKQQKAMDARIPLMTQGHILEWLRKDSNIEQSINTLTDRMSSVEKNLQLVLQKQITQVELLQQLLNTHSGSLSLKVDDNKKGEKDGRVFDQQIADQKIKDQHIKDQHLILDDQ